MKNSLVIILVIVAGIAAGLFAKNHSSSLATKTPAGWTVYSSKELRFSIAYPSTWKVDTSQEKTGRVKITSAPLDQHGVGPLDNNVISSDSSLVIDTTTVNSDHLDPKTWFKKVLAPSVNPPLSQQTITVNGLPAYSLVADEMGTLRHVYIFQGKKVVEIYYSTEQKEFASTYKTMTNSLVLN